MMDIDTNEQARTESEVNELEEFYRKINEEKGIDNFFLKIIRTKNTTKVGNLEQDELGKSQLPVRTMLELANDCDLIPSMSSFSKSFRLTSEDVLASSLSKEGFLIKSRITQKKEFSDKKRKRITKTGLFGKKEETEEPE